MGVVACYPSAGAGTEGEFKMKFLLVISLLAAVHAEAEPEADPALLLHHPYTALVHHPVVKTVEVKPAEVKTHVVPYTLPYTYGHLPYYGHHSVVPGVWAAKPAGVEKREAEPAAEPAADAEADPWYGYYGHGYGHGYGYGYGHGGYGYGHHLGYGGYYGGYGHYYGKRSAEAEPEADPYLLYGNYYAHHVPAVTHAVHPYSVVHAAGCTNNDGAAVPCAVGGAYTYGWPYAYGYYPHVVAAPAAAEAVEAERKKREAEPEAEAEADPWLTYSSHPGHVSTLYGAYGHGVHGVHGVYAGHGLHAYSGYWPYGYGYYGHGLHAIHHAVKAEKPAVEAE